MLELEDLVGVLNWSGRVFSGSFELELEKGLLPFRSRTQTPIYRRIAADAVKAAARRAVLTSTSRNGRQTPSAATESVSKTKYHFEEANLKLPSC